jgi:hypothetical protein
MHRGEDKMSTVSSGNSSLGGLGVSNFAKHDHIRTLTYDTTEQVREVDTDCRIYLRLANTSEHVFDRILDCVYPPSTIVQVL